MSPHARSRQPRGARLRTSLDSNPGVVHVASDVGEDLALEAHLADLDAVLATLLGGGRRRELDVLDAKVGERLGDLHLCLGIEKGIGELLALCKKTREEISFGLQTAYLARRRRPRPSTPTRRAQ